MYHHCQAYGVQPLPPLSCDIVGGEDVHDHCHLHTLDPGHQREMAWAPLGRCLRNRDLRCGCRRQGSHPGVSTVDNSCSLRQGSLPGVSTVDNSCSLRQGSLPGVSTVDNSCSLRQGYLPGVSTVDNSCSLRQGSHPGVSTVQGGRGILTPF
jgi:hypothetical protein